jgi:hypothetical protein
MASAVCDNDPRTLDQRRAAALGAFGHSADRLVCACENPDCDAKTSQPSTVVVHVIAHEESLTDDTPAQLDGVDPHQPPAKPLGEMTITEALTDPRPPPTGPATTPPAAMRHSGVLAGEPGSQENDT